MAVGGSGLNYDDLGFLVATKRIDKNVKNISIDIDEILMLIKQQFQQNLIENQNRLIDVNLQVIESNDLLNTNLTELNKSMLNLGRNFIDYEDLISQNSDSTGNGNSGNSSVADSIEFAEQPSNSLGRQSGSSSNSFEQQDSSPTIIDSDNISRSPTPNNNNNVRERDENGRFIGSGGQNKENQNIGEKIFDGASKLFKSLRANLGGDVDSKGIDPTLDAMNEVGSLLKPVGRVALMTLKPLTGLFKNKKRSEPLPKEQSEHNRRVERTLQSIENKSGKGLTLAGITKIIPMLAISLGAIITGGILANMPSGDEVREKAKEGWDNTKKKGGEIVDNVTNSISGAWQGIKDGASNLINGGKLKHESTPILGKYKGVGDAIATYESKGSYTVVNTGGYENRRVKGDFKTVDVPNLTNMTIQEVLQRNALPVGDKNRINTVGRYQITSKNLRSFVKNGTIKATDKLTPELQDFLFLKMMPKKLKDYADGKNNVSANEAQKAAATIWAAVPDPKTGKSVYHNVGLNRSHKNAGNILQDELHKTRSGQYNNLTKTNVGKSDNKVIQAQQSEKAQNNVNTKTSSPIVLKPNNIITSNKASSTGSGSYSEYINNVTNKMPKLESVKERVSSKPPQKVIIANQGSGSDMIAQNVSDRDLAHALTGGLGMGQRWGT